MNVLWLAIALALIAAGVAHFVRKHIRQTREDLEDVDRSKLRDLDEDGWDDDDWNDNDRDKPE